MNVGNSVESADWIQLAQNRVHWPNPMIMVMKLQVP